MAVKDSVENIGGLTPDTIARIRKVAQLAGGTQFEGERDKAIKVVLNLFKEKCGLTFPQLVEILVDSPRLQQVDSSQKKVKDAAHDSKYEESKFRDGENIYDWFKRTTQSADSSHMYDDMYNQSKSQNQRRQEEQKKAPNYDAPPRSQATRNPYDPGGPRYVPAGRKLNYGQLQGILNAFRTMVDREPTIYNCWEVNKYIITFCNYYLYKHARYADIHTTLGDNSASFIQDIYSRVIINGGRLNGVLTPKQFAWLVKIFIHIHQQLYILGIPVKQELQSVLIDPLHLFFAEVPYGY